MDFNTLIVDTFMKDLKCSVCNNYLSYFPIYLTNKDENICGRCEEPKEASRNKVYEIMANEQMFPCRYISNGCIEKLVPEKISKHENLCLYRLIECLVSRFNLCNNKVRVCDTVKHCGDMHPDLILRDGKFKIDLSISQTTQNILLKTNYVFLFETKFNSENNQLSYRILNVGIEDEEVYLYRLTLEDDSSRSLSVVGRANMDSEIVDYKNLDLNIFKDLQENFISCRICIKPETGSLLSNNDMELEALNTFKCSNCSNFIRPEVVTKDKQKKCPSCEQDYILEDNAAELGEKIPFPCKNQKNGCTRCYHLRDLDEHELYCPYGQSVCIVSEDANCKWSGPMRDLTTHITEDHSDLIATTNIFREGLKNSVSKTAPNFDKSYVIKMSKHLFLVTFFSDNEIYNWSVQQIGKYDDTFCYELEIFDEQNNRLIVKKPCNPITHEEGLAACSFTFEQLPKTKVVFSDMVVFKIQIFKNCG